MSTKSRRRRVAKRRRALRVEAKRALRTATNPHWLRQTQRARDMVAHDAALDAALIDIFRHCEKPGRFDLGVMEETQ